jgi:O-acetylhomoserine (thiol)-lyase
MRPTTKLLLGETVGGPARDVLDIPTIAAVAHEAGVPLLVDATLTSPWLVQPLALGADLVIHATAPYLCGHGTVMGGVVVDGGSFDWARAYAASGRFAELATPCDGFGGHELP